MSPLGGAVTMDIDAKGKVWASARTRVQFDPVTEKFTDFKSTLRSRTTRARTARLAPRATATATAVAQMAFDIHRQADMVTGKVTEITLPSLKNELDRATPAAREFYENFNERTNGNPLPWSQGPRRMGTDKNGDVLWVGNSWAQRWRKSTPRRSKPRSSRSRTRPCSPTTSRSTQPQCVGQLWTSDPHRKIRSDRRQVDLVRPAGARHRNPPRLAPGARRQDQGDRAGLPFEPDGRDDVAQRGRWPR